MFSPQGISHVASPTSRKRSPASKLDTPGKFIKRLNKLNKLNEEGLESNKYSSLIKTIPKEKNEIQRML